MKGLPLAVVPQRSQVDCLQPFIEGRACVVLGSAPLATTVADVADSDVLIAVNGGISSAPRECDIWFVGSKQQDKPGDPFLRPLHRTMLEQCQGRHVRHAVFLRGPKTPTEHYTLKALKLLNCTTETWSVLDKPTKRDLEGELCGRVSGQLPCSSGILAVACALWCGAASVRMIGFSLKAGYHYIRDQAHPPDWWRDHRHADATALLALRARYGATLTGDLVEQVAA